LGSKLREQIKLFSSRRNQLAINEMKQHPGAGKRRLAAYVEYYGENTFCGFVSHDAFGCYGDTKCYGSGDLVFAR